MDLREVIMNYYPELTFADFDEVRNGTIKLKDDSDGQGPYIAKWEYEKPIPEGLHLGKSA